MGIGKYSPTVSTSYSQDQEWYEKNGGGYGNGKDPESYYDDDGFDSYGYNAEGRDRAGHHENDYPASFQWDNDSAYYPLHEDVESEWSGRNILSMRKAREEAATNPEMKEVFRQLAEVQDILRKASDIERSLKADIQKVYPQLLMD